VTIKPGDLFFTTSRSFVSDVIRFVTHSKWSHVQIISRIDTNRHLYQTGGIEVITADTPIVICRDVSPDEWAKYAILSLKGDHAFFSAEVKRVLDFCFSCIGKGYDYWGLADFLFNEELQTVEKWFCSELAYTAYLKAPRQLQERIKGAYVSPELLYVSPLLRVEEEVS